jgi:hypothetical protein
MIYIIQGLNFSNSLYLRVKITNISTGIHADHEGLHGLVRRGVDYLKVGVIIA